MDIEVHALFVGGELFDVGDHLPFFQALADGVHEGQAVTMIKPDTGERRLYAIKRYLDEYPTATAQDVEREFGLTVGELVTALLDLQRAGLIESVRLGLAAAA